MDKKQKLHDFTMLYLSKNLEQNCSIAEILQKYDETYEIIKIKYEKLHPIKPMKVLSRDKLL